MVNRLHSFLIFVFVGLGIAGFLFLGLWKFGVGEWTFLASIICLIVGTVALFYVLASVEKRETKILNRRLSYLLYPWLALMAIAILFFGLGKVGVGEWAFLVSMLSTALFVLAPVFWFIIQPDLAITTFNVLTGSINAPDDWKALHPIRRAVVYFGTVICLAIGIIILKYVFSHIFSG